MIPEPRPVGPAVAREQYLSQVATKLGSRMSPFEVFETVSEIRAHIDAMAAAYEELGIPPDEAMQAALAKFGSPKTVGKSLAKAVGIESVDGSPAALLLTLAGTFTLGGLSLLMCDSINLAPTQAPMVHVDFAAGGSAGILIGLLAWQSRQKPVRFAATICGLTAVLLGILFVPNYYGGFRSPTAYLIVVELLFGAYITSVHGVNLARYLRKRFPGQMSKPKRPTTQ